MPNKMPHQQPDTLLEKEQQEQPSCSGGGFSPTEAQQAVWQTLAVSSDNNDKEPFFQALQHAAALVWKETPALDFIQRENGNVTAAAKRLLRYWKYRKIVFGQDHWLLPLTQTGRGALQSSTIEIIRSGVFTYIAASGSTETTTTTTTTPVMVMDLSRLSPQRKGMIGQDCWPWAMYMGTVCSNVTTQTIGIQLIHILNRHHRLEFFPGLWEMMSTALPVKFIPGVLLIPTANPTGERLLQEYLALQACRMVEYNRKKTPLLIHADTVPGRLRLLESRGIPRQGLPSSVGGTFGPLQYDNWIRVRLSLENAMSAAPLVANARVFPTFTAVEVAAAAATTTTMTTARCWPALDAAGTATSTDTTTRTRNERQQEQLTLPMQQQQQQQSVVHETNDNKQNVDKHDDNFPKRKRKVTKPTLKELMQKRDYTKKQNLHLRSLNRSLMDMVAQARYLVAMHNSSSSNNNNNDATNNNNHNYHNDITLPQEQVLHGGTTSVTANASVHETTSLQGPGIKLVVAADGAPLLNNVEDYPERTLRVKKPTEYELLEQRDQWKVWNQDLTADNCRLETLLAQARSVVAAEIDKKQPSQEQG